MTDRSKGMERVRRSKALRVLLGGSAVTVTTNGAVFVQEALAEGAGRDVPVTVEGHTVNVAVDPSAFDDSMDSVHGGANMARNPGATNKTDSHDNSAKDVGDSKGESATNTGKGEGSSAGGGGGGGGAQTNKTDSHDNSAKDVGDSKGESATNTGKGEGDSAGGGGGGGGAQTNKTDSHDNSAKDVGDSVGDSANDTGKDTQIGDTADQTGAKDSHDNSAKDTASSAGQSGKDTAGSCKNTAK